MALYSYFNHKDGFKQSEEEASMAAVCILMTTVWPPNYAIQNVSFTASILRIPL
jgi:hypothetical protein